MIDVSAEMEYAVEKPNTGLYMTAGRLFPAKLVGNKAKLDPEHDMRNAGEVTGGGLLCTASNDVT